MTREEFIAAVDWPQVRADVAGHRAYIERCIEMRTAELRGGSDVPTDLHDAVPRAEYREALSACDDLIAAIDGHTGG